jgi:hypothetical protein
MARLNLIPLAFGEMIPVINNPRGASIKRYNTPIHAKLISVLAKEYRKR